MNKNLLPRPRPPPPQRKQRNPPSHCNRIIHIRRRDRLTRWEEQHHTNKAHPRNRYKIYWFSIPPQCVWPLDEPDFTAKFVPAPGDDDGDVGEVEGGRGDAEDCENGFSGAKSDEVHGNAAEDDEPDGVDGGMCVGVYLRPEAVEG